MKKIEKIIEKPFQEGLNTYSLNFKELNNLIYTYSSRQSKLENNELRTFLLSSLSPENTAQKVRQLASETFQTSKEPIITYDSKFVEDLFQKIWKSLARQLNFLISIIKLLQIMCRFSIPYLLDELTNNFKSNAPDELIYVAWLNQSISIESLSWLYVWMLIFVQALSVFLDAQYSWNINKLRCQGTTVLQFLIYQKLVKAKFVETSKSDEAQQANINNLMTIDCEKFLNIFSNFHEAWGSLVNLTFIIGILFFKMKSALPVGIIVVCFLFWLTSRISKKMSGVFPRLMKLRDRRIELTSDILQGIKSIKYLCWESVFQGKLQNYRKEEFEFLSKLKYLDSCCVLIWAITSTSLITASLISYSLAGYDITNSNIFTDIVYFQMLIGPLNALPWNITSIFDSLTSLKRIKAFLTKQEIPKPNTFDNIETGTSQSNYSIILQAKAMTWPRINQDSCYTFFKLRDIELKIKQGTLNMVIGNVSSGKTGLLNAIMGEMTFLTNESTLGSQQELNTSQQEIEKKSLNRLENDIQKPLMSSFENGILINGSIAYVPQNPWLQKQTIRENILFGKKYEPSTYKQCLEACDLVSDVEKLPGGDNYDVGQNGSNLSGGQRQRISLCRALYQDADIYLLDDILSSVDVSVAKIIFKKAVIGHLMKRKKTVMIVLSQYKYLKHSDRIFLMHNGQIIEESSSIKNFLEGRGPKKEDEEPSISNIDENKGHEIIDDLEETKGEDPNTKDLLTKEDTEQKEKGEVKLKTLMSYINAMGLGVVGLIMIGAAFMQISCACFDFWLQDYIENKAKGQNPKFFILSFEVTLLILLLFSVVSCAYRAWIFVYGHLKCSKAIINRLIPKVLYAQMTFFDANPVGRIIQRFSEDSWSLDYELPFRLSMFLNNIVIFGRILFVYLIEVPLILLLVVPIGFIFSILQDKYRRISRDLKRMYSTNNGRMLTHLIDTASGTVLIRAFKKEEYMSEIFLDQIGDTITTKSLMDATRTWFGIRLRSLSLLISASVLIFTLLYKYYISKRNSFGGLALVLQYALTSPLNFEDIITTFADTEKEFIGVERISQYLENKTEQEEIEDALNQETQMSASLKQEIFPSNAQPRDHRAVLDPFAMICFRNVSLKYTSGEREYLALKGINLDIKRHEKVVLCGRTGSGKTTILNSLLKLYEIDEGEIIFNEKNIKNISKKELRSNIAVIPQFGFMYEATLGENLDPYDVTSKAKLQKVLEKGREFMKKASEKYHEANLKNQKKRKVYQHADLFKEDFMINRSGNNLSNGEKQIINFLRILLQDSQVIFLDEATSNVDPITDELMHNELFKMCEDKTLIVITHRLDYLKHFDRVVLIENGEIIDQGKYEELLSKSNGKFKAFASENNHC